MNTLKKYGFSLALLVTALTLSGCNDNIDLSAEGLIGAESYFTTAEDYDKALNSVYGRLNPGTTYNMWIDGVTDDGLVTHSWNRGYDFGRGTANSSSSFPRNRWEGDYVAVQMANNVISNIDTYDWPGGAANVGRNTCLAEARTLRAYFYLDLVSLFGNVMFYEKNPATVAEANEIPQVEPKVVFDFILKELGDAISALPDTPANKSKIGKAAARLLRARAAAYAAGYLNDKSYFNTTLSETGELMKTLPELGDYSALFRSGNESIAEVIMVKSYSADSKNDFGQWCNNSIGGYCVTTPTKALVDAHEYMGEVKPNLPYVNKEPRFYANILAPGAIFRGKYYNTIPGIEVSRDGKEYFDPASDYGAFQETEIAHGDVLGQEGGGEWNKTPSGLSYNKYYQMAETWNAWNSYVLFRYGEVLLLRAEALAETGGSVEEAKALIKTLRQRAGNTNDIDATLAGTYKGNLLDMIRNERRVEMAQEGLRLFDIRRWKILLDVMNKPVGGIEYRDATGNKVVLETAKRSAYTEKDYWWPIPQNEIDLDKTKRIKQNAGW